MFGKNYSRSLANRDKNGVCITKLAETNWLKHINKGLILLIFQTEGGGRGLITKSSFQKGALLEGSGLKRERGA